MNTVDLTLEQLEAFFLKKLINKAKKEPLSPHEKLILQLFLSEKHAYVKM